MSSRDFGTDDLRELFQNQPRTAAPDETCPSPDTLWASARGELEPAEARRVIDHTGRCPSCAEDWRLARFVSRRAPEGSDAEGTRPWGSAGWSRSLVAAAAVVAALGTGIFLWQDTGQEPVYRDAPEQSIESLVPEDEPLSRSEPVLDWSGPDGATYTLVVTTERGRILVWEDGLTESEYRLPEEVVTGVSADPEPGEALLWQVEASLPDGSRLPSGTFRVRLE